MKYDLKKPCKSCPFRHDTHFTFPHDRVEEILYSPGGFACHNTTIVKRRSVNHHKAQACAGRLILLEREGLSDQMMRIAERLGFYDRTQLDINDPYVFEDIDSFEAARTE